MNAHEILKALGVDGIQSGTNFGVGQWSNDTSGGVIESINPANGEVLGKVYASTAADYEKVIQSSRAAYAEWRKMPAPKRGEIVRQMGEALRAKKDLLGSLVTLEMGKIKAEGDGEVQEMIDMADFAVGQSRMLYGLSMHSERPEHSMKEQWHPLGLVGVMSAFNFPVAVWSWNAFLAAICGNVTVWKPSPKTPLCAVAVQKICDEVLKRNNAPAIFQLFIDSPKNELAMKFVEDKRVEKMSFTGSTQIGRLVGAKVAERFGKCLLELSGNNAIIVDESADLKIAVPSIVFGSVGTAGQRCTTTRRLIVHKSREQEVINAIVSAYKQVRIGDPLDKNTLMGPLIDEAAVKMFENAVELAKADGGEVLAGGKRLNRPGHYIEPTIIRAKNHFRAVQNETFAAILYVMTYDTLEEAIALNNESKFGLSSSIFTNNMKNAEVFLSAVGSDCGIANVNIGTSGAEIGGAFGGEKDTGGGREAGSDAWKSYMRRQTNTIFYGNKATLAQGIEFNL